MDENLSMQVEEIETLCSIYGSKWVTVDEAQRSYSIQITEEKQNVAFFVTLPCEYPLYSPPTYELFAPSLTREAKAAISKSVNGIYLENAGEPILFQWVETIREILRAINAEQTSEEPTIEPEEFVAQIKDDNFDKGGSSSSVDSEPVVTHGPTIVDRKSTFQAHVAVVDSAQQAKQVLASLLTSKKVANATHNISAYRIENKQSPSSHIQDCDDDGETQAGSRMLHLLQVVGAENVMVVVSRWYGGVQLGPDRFRHINNAARQALELAGHIQKKKSS